jgi:hypothetical protein
MFTFVGVRMSNTWIDLAAAQIKKLTPKTGFNVVAVDSYENPGEALYFVDHFDNAEEAEKARATYQKKHKDVAYVYPARKIKNEELSERASSGTLTTRGFPVGTIRPRADGTRYKKSSSGEWEYYAEPESGKPGKIPFPSDKPAASAASVPAGKPEPAPASPEKSSKKTFGGKLKSALGAGWDTLKEPFVGAFHLATKKSARKAFKEKIGGAFKQETKETKAMLGTLKKGLTGQKVTKEERTAAINQAADLVKAALIGTMYGSIAAQGIGELLATIASPVEEIVGALLDKPLRKITKKVFGQEHGILPSAFYSSEGDSKDKHEWIDALDAALTESDDSEAQDLMMRIADAVMDELASSGIADEDLDAALTKAGVTAEKAQKFVSRK